MKRTFFSLKSSLLENVLKLFSASAVMFTFQCCYGTPQDFGSDVHFSGTVKSASNNQAIEGIQISANNNFCITDSNGNFSFYTTPESEYYFRFEDADTTSNGSYKAKDTTVKDNSQTEIVLNVFLETNEK